MGSRITEAVVTSGLRNAHLADSARSGAEGQPSFEVTETPARAARQDRWRQIGDKPSC